MDNKNDHVKPVAWKKPGIIIMHAGPNDLIEEVNTTFKLRKVVTTIIQETDSIGNIQLDFSDISQRTDIDYSKEIKEISIKLKRYCLGKGLIFIDNSSIDGF